MPARHALVIAVDGLRASALGAYGNTWYETPALDAFASRSHVVDWMWCDSPSVAGFYRGAWNGLQDHAGSSLAQLLTQAGVAAALTTDDAEVAEAGGFAEVCRVETQAARSASMIDETALARLFAVAAEQVQSSKGGLIWVHARGFHGPWDAPMELREELLDDEDPPPPTFVDPPAMVTTADQDDALVHRAAYAAQAMVLDDCIGGLLAALAESPLDESPLGRETLVVLVGVRGFALGEHGGIGGDCRSLYSELLHVPCLVRVPAIAGPPVRLSMLAQPVDLFGTLLNWFGVDRPAAPPAWDLLSSKGESGVCLGRQFVAARGLDGEEALRTAAWMLRRPPRGDGIQSTPVAELYAKPDDRWEANEIADRCSDVAQRLLAALDQRDSTSMGPLDDDLAGPVW